MWGPGSCGSVMWGFWWVFPLVGALVCLTLIVLAVRFLSTGRGFACMGGHAETGNDQTAALRREVSALREEIKLLRPAG
jgi:hypothetical protein